MTYKKFVEQAIIANCEKSVKKFLNENTYINCSEIIDLDMKEMTYKVSIVVHEFGNFIDRIYHIGGAFNEYANLYPSVIWNMDNEIIYMFTTDARKALNLPDTIGL